MPLTENGCILTHSGSRTSVPGVFAAGDVQDHVYLVITSAIAAWPPSTPSGS
jgi:thioredoxin reductase